MIDRQRTFVELGKKLRSKSGEQNAADQKEHRRCRRHQSAPRDDVVECPCVAPPQRLQHVILAFMRVITEERCRQRRNQCDADDDGANQGENHGQRHRPEHLSFDARQRENRDICRDDDDHPEQRRLEHFARGVAREAQALIQRHRATQVLPLRSQSTHSVLDDNHGPIDDQTEVDRTETHEIRRYFEIVHANDGREHRERDRRGHDEPGANLQKKDEEDRDDKQAAFDQVLARRVDRLIDEAGAVVERLDDDVRRERLLDFSQALLDARSHYTAVLALQQDGHAQNRLAAGVPGCGPLPNLRSDPSGRDVADTHRRAVLSGDDDVLDIGDRPDQSNPAEELLLSATLEVRSAAIDVVAFERFDDLSERQLIANKPTRIDEHLVLALAPSKAVDLDDAGHGAQLRFDHPVEDGAQVHEVVRLHRTRQA